MSLAKTWVSDCTSKHNNCHESTGTAPWYPTRLLDCGPLESMEPDCRLVTSADVVPDGPYIALSHCWGRAECLKLKVSNFAQMQAGIPFLTLPQLYRDSVLVVRKLGMRYLWIDSLCIIQEGDSQEDWAREVQTMGDVYAKAFCTISAAVAPDGDHSMFQARNPDTLNSQVVSFNIDGQVEPYLLSDAWTWEMEIEEALINTRGWVLQERLLSPRVIYFGKRQVFWECREGHACETYPTGIPGLNHNMVQDYKNQFSMWKIMTQEEKSASGYVMWSKVVTVYTKCGLSFLSDKLVALSAVAKSLKRTSKTTTLRECGVVC